MLQFLYISNILTCIDDGILPTEIVSLIPMVHFSTSKVYVTRKINTYAHWYKEMVLRISYSRLKEFKIKTTSSNWLFAIRPNFSSFVFRTWASWISGGKLFWRERLSRKVGTRTVVAWSPMMNEEILALSLFSASLTSATKKFLQESVPRMIFGIFSFLFSFKRKTHLVFSPIFQSFPTIVSLCVCNKFLTTNFFLHYSFRAKRMLFYRRKTTFYD